MIKFFRNIRIGLLAENKFSMYLIFALGEIALIMLGILLALQVSEWNQAKKDHIEERLILSRFSNELTKNSEKIASLLKGFDGKEKALEQVSLAFKGRPIENDSLFLLDVIKSSHWGWTVQPLQRLIFEEVNNTGRLVIVQNIELRSTITELYDLVEVLEGTALARASDYAKIVYTLVPRETEGQMKKDLSSSEQKGIVDAILNSNLDQVIIYEQNRARYLKQIWNIIEGSIAQVKAEIESEMNK
jgi:DNA gyrase/topoisomerase IV subunit B